MIGRGALAGAASWLLTALLLLLALRAPAAVAQEQRPEPTAVQGAGSAAEAPTLTQGVYADLIREPETLWYAIDARQGQQAAATVVVRGRPDGPPTDRSELRVALLDSQRQPSGEAAIVPFTGVADARAEVVGEVLPDVGADGAYLTVSLASPSGANDLRELGYQLEFGLGIGGEPSDGPAAGERAERPEPAASPEPEPEPAPVTPVQLLPVVLIAFALGGFGGFELMRRWLRTH